MQLTEQQLKAVDRGESVSIEADGRTYVLLSEDMYQLVRNMFDEGLTLETVAGLIRQTMADDNEEDLLLDSYQKYRRTS